MALVDSIEERGDRQDLPEFSLSRLPEKVRTYPSLNAAFLKTNASVGRVLYLARALDEHGSGRIDIEELRALLTDKRSQWCVFSWRRLRTIFADGEELGVWHRSNGKLWLYAPDRIAIALNAGPLRGRAVYVPTSPLIGTIADVRAAFYASVEDGRQHRAPMSRAAVGNITGVGRRTQREYDKRLNRPSIRNILIGDRYDVAALQDEAWKGRAVFRFVDHKNIRGGGKGAQYNARRLPDTRERCFAVAPKGRTRKYNKKIRDNLVNKPGQGSVGNPFVRTYHPSPEAAARAFDCNPNRSVLYPEGSAVQPTAYTRTRLQAVQIWSELSL